MTINNNFNEYKKIKVEVDQLNKNDLQVFAQLIKFYDRHGYDRHSRKLEGKIEELYRSFFEDLKAITDNEKNNLKELYKTNNSLISAESEIWYSFTDKKEYVSGLSDKEVNKLKTENKQIDRLNLKLTDTWLKIVKSGVWFRRFFT